MTKKATYKILGTTAYEVLGIEKDATQGDAKLRFGQLTRKFHPDKNPGDKIAEEKFKEVAEAWAELRDVLPKALFLFPIQTLTILDLTMRLRTGC